MVVMSDSLFDILGKKDFAEPPEIATIKNYVYEKYGEKPKIKLTDNAIFIGVSNSSLAGALRLQLHELKEKLKTKKRLVIRIS